MNDYLDEIWMRSCRDEHLPNAEAALTLVSKATASERRRNRMLLFSGLNLTWMTIAAIWSYSVAKLTLSETWPAALAMGTLWATFVGIVRSRIRVARQYSGMRDDMVTAVRRALGQAEATARELMAVLIVNGVVVLPVVVASAQILIDGSKMSSGEALSFGLFAGVVLCVNLLGVAFYRWKRILPRAQALRGVAASMQ